MLQFARQARKFFDALIDVPDAFIEYCTHGVAVSLRFVAPKPVTPLREVLSRNRGYAMRSKPAEIDQHWRCLSVSPYASVLPTALKRTVVFTSVQ